MADEAEEAERQEGVASSSILPAAEVGTTPTMIASSSLPAMSRMQLSLMNTLTDMAVRSQVEDCIHDVLTDVETAYYLRQELELREARHARKKVHQQHQATIFEADTERQARSSMHVELADEMVKEVMSLNQELEALLQWKRDHAHKVQEYDVLVATLAQADEDLEVAQQRVQQIKDMPPPPSEDSPVKELDLKDETRGPKDDSVEDSKPPAMELLNEGEVGGVDSLAFETAESSARGNTEVEKAPEATNIDKPSAAAVAVTLDVEEPSEKLPNLVDLDVEVLMTIFGFIDAMDILNMAQINLSMYTKIDNIFGIAEDGQAPPQPTPLPSPAPQAQSPAAALKPAATSIAGATPSDSATVSGPIGNRLFSMLQPTKTVGPVSNKKPSQSLTPSAVQSMAAKLNDAEVAAILSMTDKLHRLDKEVNILREQKETMAAKLDGTEAVKQFLINKVRDVEQKLAKSREDETKVTQQIASDQEVIAFLDTRVQELERQNETLATEKSRAQNELDTIKVQTSKKITMLSDMLKYEREKLKDEEGEWKATKKVLVKEVKNCRAQILALQAERDGLKEHNEMLKRAIVATGKSPANRTTSPLR